MSLTRWALPALCVCAGVCGMLFTVFTWLWPFGVTITKPLPVLLFGVGGCTVIIVDKNRQIREQRNKLAHYDASICFTLLSGYAFIIYAAGDCTTEVGDYTTISTWVVIGGILFALGQMVFSFAALWYAHDMPINTTSTFKLVAGTICLLDFVIIALVQALYSDLTTTVRVYLCVQCVQCFLSSIAFSFVGIWSIMLTTLSGIVCFSISDAFVFAVDYGYLGISTNVGSVLTMWIYWLSCALMFLGVFHASQVDTTTLVNHLNIGCP